MKINFCLLYIFFTFVLIQNTEALSTHYQSFEDEDITIKSVYVTKGKDNVQSIYARPLSEHIIQLIEKDRFFETIKIHDNKKESTSQSNTTETNTSNLDINELRDQPKLTTEFITKIDADALIHLQASKGPMGLQIEIGLFTKKSGRIWAYTEKLITDKFDLDHVKSSVTTLYTQIMNQIPYQGLVLSRTGGNITINRGSNARLTPDMDINIVQIVEAQRHPQFQFVTHVEKEIIGKIRLTKVDENLSFGYLLYEKEPQSIQPGLKVLLREPVIYPSLASSKNKEVVDHMLARGDGSVIMQGVSQEWVPLDKPTFGRAHVLFGVGQFNSSTNLSTDGSQQVSSPYALNANVDAEIWLTKTWFLHAGLTQGSVQTKNPLSDSTPDKLNFSLQGLKLAAGYNFEISNSIYGSRLLGLFGFSQFNASTTESSPTSFTSATYSGLAMGVSGYFPWDEIESHWGYGAEIWYHILPSVSEKPVSSGSSSSTQTIELSGTALYRWRPNLYWIGKLSIDSLNTSFSGTGTRTQSASATDYSWVRLNGGIEYLF